jgi:hypothetical protein
MIYPMTLSQKRIFLFTSVFAGISLVAVLIIKIGYRPDLAGRTFRPTGLLVTTSIPNGASVYIDGKLKTATDNTLNLSPGKYDIEIKKDGFYPWKKRLTIKTELVTKADAWLFSTYPDLKALTFTGAVNPVFSPDEQKVAFAVVTASAANQGIWILDLADRPLGLNSQPRQILQSIPKGKDLSTAVYEWSPDTKQILLTLSKESYLIDTARLNLATGLTDISLGLTTLKKRWQDEEAVKQEAKMARLPEKLFLVLKNSVKNIQFSPDETKIMYTATASATIPDGIIPPLANPGTQKESRTIEPGKLYIYDLKEDKNFYITEAVRFEPPKEPSKSKGKTPTPLVKPTTNISWYPTSKHIFIVQSNKISIGEYDNTNWADVYTGTFENLFAFPFPAGNRFLVLTSIGKDTPLNLYAVTLR